jgi:hypothetical protein
MAFIVKRTRRLSSFQLLSHTNAGPFCVPVLHFGISSSVGTSDMSRVVRSVITIVDIYYGSGAPVNVQNRAP